MSFSRWSFKCNFTDSWSSVSQQVLCLLGELNKCAEVSAMTPMNVPFKTIFLGQLYCPVELCLSGDLTMSPQSCYPIVTDEQPFQDNLLSKTIIHPWSALSARRSEQQDSLQATYPCKASLMGSTLPAPIPPYPWPSQSLHAPHPTHPLPNPSPLHNHKPYSFPIQHHYTVKNFQLLWEHKGQLVYPSGHIIYIYIRYILHNTNVNTLLWHNYIILC